jgi:plasmid maintenance system killer protein
MSQGFADKTTEQIWKGIPKRLMNSYLQRQSLKRLGYLNLAKKSRISTFHPPTNFIAWREPDASP